MSDPGPLLALLRRVLERHLPPQDAHRAALDVLISLDQEPIPSARELDQIRRDLRVLELIGQGVPAETVALRLGCDRSTVYRAQDRGRALKRTA